MNCDACSLFVRSQGKRQLLQYSSNVKKVVLLVEITNVPGPGKVAEDAHQAMLNISTPSTLRYSGVRSHVSPPEGDRGLGGILAVDLNCSFNCSTSCTCR